LEDKIIYYKIQLMLIEVKLDLISGAAPIAPEILDYLKMALCVPIVVGFGEPEILC
jgi:long-subunit acyl-CoA synthetase (AMP-forming)